MGVDLGSGDILVPQELLDCADVIAFLEQSRSEAVPESMRFNRLLDASLYHRSPDIFAQRRIV
jgi:hypothetical protein